MKKSCSLLILLCFVISACTPMAPVSSTKVMTGPDAEEIPPSFAQFPDIPFPEKTVMNLSKTKILGSGDSWTGSIVFNAPYNTGAMFDFYMSEMPKFGWEEIAVVRSEMSNLTYSRGNRVALILIGASTSNTEVSLTVVPRKSSLKTEQ